MSKNITQLFSSHSLRNRGIYPYLFFVFFIWVSRFLFVNSFGFYEDDWHFIGTAITNNFEQNWSRLHSAYTTFFQGRPLYITFVTIFPMLAAKLGGIKTLYSIGFLILSVNACLLYKTLTKVINQPHIPFFATLIFCLYPSDTTFTFLLHLFELQIAFLFILLAFYFYFSSKTVICYVFAIFSLLTYETPFLTFLVAPFFLKENNKKKTITHCIILTSIAIVYLLVRKILGESTVVDLKILSTLQILIHQVIFGPLISFGMFFIRPWQVIFPFRLTNFLVLLFTLPIFYFIISSLTKHLLNTRGIEVKIKRLQEIKKLLLIGFAMIILAYPITVTLDVNFTDGRASRVHFAAVLGIALMIASLWSLILNQIPQKLIWKNIAVFLISLHISFLFVFCINVQQFYSLSWKYQQAFWSDAIALSSDLEQETVILVQAPTLAWGKQINPFDWSVPSVLGSIYNFPKDWKFPPRLYILDSNVNNIDGWKSMIDKNDKFFMSNKNGSLRYYYEWEPERKVDAKNIILLVEENNQLVRKPFLKLSNGNLISLKQKNDKIPLQKYKKSVLFNRLIDDALRTKSNNRPAIYFESQH
jgi:hypothetical protein